MDMALAIKEYLREIEFRKYTQRTIKSYRNNLDVFLAYCKQSGCTGTEELTIGLVKGFMIFMTGRGRKGTYINSLLKTIKSFITYCHQEGYGGFDTKHRFAWCKEEKPVIRAFQPEDVKRLLRDCSGKDFMSVRDKCILIMFFETGIRCLELCSIADSDIHDDYIIINGKNHKQRVVPVTPVLYKAIIKYRHARDNYFPFPKCDSFFVSFHGRKLNNSAVENVLKRHGKGIEGIRVSPHTCRHFFAQQQVKMGTDLYTISRLLGHENIAITQTYLNSLRDEDVVQIAKNKSVLQSID